MENSQNAIELDARANPENISRASSAFDDNESDSSCMIINSSSPRVTRENPAPAAREDVIDIEVHSQGFDILKGNTALDAPIDLDHEAVLLCLGNDAARCSPIDEDVAVTEIRIVFDKKRKLNDSSKDSLSNDLDSGASSASPSGVSDYSSRRRNKPAIMCRICHVNFLDGIRDPRSSSASEPGNSGSSASSESTKASKCNGSDDSVDMYATTCGHIFCLDCILRSLEAHPNRCPVCRSVCRGRRDFFRLYP